MTLPHATHTGRRDREPPPFQRLRDTDLTPGPAARSPSRRPPFSTSGAVRFFRIGLAPADLLQRQLRRLCRCRSLAPGRFRSFRRGAWHRFHSLEGLTQMGATPFPGEAVELDVDDLRSAGGLPVW